MRHISHVSPRSVLLAAALLAQALISPPHVVAQATSPDWPRVEAETMEHFQAILRLDTSNPPGNEGLVVDYLEAIAVDEPRTNSMLRTSVSPNILTGGYQVNIIPSEATATLDVRALPDENIEQFIAEIPKVATDPTVEVVRNERNTRPGAPPSRIESEAFLAAEGAVRTHYGGNFSTLPAMSPGATDMAYLRAKGMQCYGVGPLTDSEDGPKGFGAPQRSGADPRILAAHVRPVQLGQRRQGCGGPLR